MPKKDRSQDDANFQNKTPPSSQTELRQMAEQNTANSVIKFEKNIDKYLRMSIIFSNFAADFKSEISGKRRVKSV